MSALSFSLRQQTAARRRVVVDWLAVGLPLALAAGGLAWRFLGVWAGVALGLAFLAATVVLALWRARRLNRSWLIAQLNARIPQFEDSAGLLFSDPDALGGFARLQRDRLEARAAEAEAVDLRPSCSRRAIVAAWSALAAAAALLVLWPASGDLARPTDAVSDPSARAGPPVVQRTRLRIVPPRYTGLPAREEGGLDARVPEGSRLEWTIDMAPRPASAQLAFPGAEALTLTRRGGGWRGGRVIDASTLYRLEAPGLERQRLHRLDAIADAAPAIRIIEPDGQLVLTTPGQRRWTPVFEATDDYGIVPSATLRIAVTQGDGENITVKHRTVPLTGRGDARRKRFSVPLDLAREGLAPGGDMIVQLVVSDNREPRRQVVEGPSVILRWPAEQGLAGGLDGMVQRAMPAYFRSQRQIIIDAEALIAQRRRLDPDVFQGRSNGLGVDQAQLRLRYGQFMGEESEGGGTGGGIALPTNDAPARRPTLPTNDAPAPRPAPAAAAHDDHGHDDGHDHGADRESPAFGAQVDVVQAFGHAHDSGEAATLFDPGTRSTLRQALNAMWGSERALRQGRPEDALPFANRALELLKEAQQATRIFLARTGANLPPVDMSRRLSGKREGIVAGPLAPLTRPAADAVAADAWRALQGRPGTAQPAPINLDTLDRWVRDNQAKLADPLALTAAIETVRDEPGCAACRDRLRGLLWTVLDRPPAAVQRRATPTERGRRYLEALQ